MGKSVFCFQCKIKHSRPVGKRCHITLALSASLQQERSGVEQVQSSLSYSVSIASTVAPVTQVDSNQTLHAAQQLTLQACSQIVNNSLENVFLKVLKSISDRITATEDWTRSRCDTVTSTPECVAKIFRTYFFKNLFGV